MSLISVLQSMNFYTDVTSVDIDTNGDGQPDQTISINQISQSEVVSSAIKLSASDILRIFNWTAELFSTGNSIIIDVFEQAANAGALRFAEAEIINTSEGPRAPPALVDGELYLSFTKMDSFYGLTREGEYLKIDPIILYSHEISHLVGREDPDAALPWDTIQNGPEYDYYGGDSIYNSATRFEHYVAEILGLGEQKRAGYIAGWSTASPYHDYIDENIDYIGYSTGRLIDQVRVGKVDEGSGPFFIDSFGDDRIVTSGRSDRSRELVFGFGTEPGFEGDFIQTGDGDDVIYGGDAPDEIDAGADDDWVFAGGGDDEIIGGTGIDLIDGDSDYSPAGDDFGTGGDDELTYSGADFSIQVEFGSPLRPFTDRSVLTVSKTARDGTSQNVGTDTVNGVETVLGSGFADVIVLDSNTPLGDWTGVVIDLGASGDDTNAEGERIVDTVNAENFNGTLTFDLKHGDDDGLQTVTGGSISINFKNVEAAVGGAGSDTFYGGSEGNVFVGNGGFDTVDYSRGDQPIEINYSEEDGEAKINVKDGEGGTDRLETIEKIVGTSGFDLLQIVDPITTTNLTIDGGGGQEASGNGKPREDIINGSGSTEGLVVNIDQDGNGFVSNGGGGQINLTGFNTQIVTSAYDDQITDDSSGNKRLAGGQGNDIISTSGTSGNVTLVGGDGDDTLTGGSGNDYLVGSKGETDSRGNSESNVLSGGAGSDHIVSTSWREQVFGGDGDDFLDLRYDVNGSLLKFVSERVISGGTGDDVVTLKDAYTSLDVIFNKGDGHDFIETKEGAFVQSAWKETSLNIYIADATASDITLIFDSSVVDSNGSYSGVSDLVIRIESTGDTIYIPHRRVRWSQSESSRSANDINIYAGPGQEFLNSTELNVTVGDISFYRTDLSSFDSNREPDPADTQGTGGDDHLEGGRGDDNIDGGAGDDTVSTSGGNDTIDGGAGNDTLYIFGSKGHFTISGSASSAVLSDDNGLEGQVTLTSVENVFFVTDGENYTMGDLFGYYGTEFDDEIEASDQDSEILGLDGNDTINALGGDDQITGGLGHDIIDGGDGDDRAIYSGSSSDYSITRLTDGRTLVEAVTSEGVDGNDELRNVETIFFEGDNRLIDVSSLPLSATEGDDVLIGTDDDDNLSGLGGGDVLEGGPGRDTLDGGPGFDTARFSGNSDDYQIYFRKNGSLTVYDNSGDDGLDRLSNVEALYFAGDDRTILAQDLPPLGTSEDDEITGTDRSDVLYGLDGDDTLVGGEGDDELDGGAGADTMRGGLGDDYYEVDDPNDVVIESAGEGDDFVSSSVSYTLGANVEGLSLWSDAPTDGTGNELDNEIYGDSFANTLLGLDGDDLISGDGGDDLIDGGQGSDTVEFYSDVSDYEITRYQDGRVVVTDSSGYEGSDTLLNVEYLTFYGGRFGGPTTITVSDLPIDDGGSVIRGDFGNNVLTGTSGNDVILAGDGDDTLDGGDGNDRLNGQAGADAMTGGLGDDIYYVDNVGDTVSENASEGADTVASTIDFILGDNVEKLTLIGAAVINGTGNALDNRIVGNSSSNILLGLAGDDVIIAGEGDDTLDGGDGNDRLNGQAGADAMTGGLGDDIYYVDDLADTINENADEGIDTVVSTVSHTLGANVEKLTLTGTMVVDGIGNALDNRIVGNAAANMLQGHAGDDVIIAGDGNDILDGGEGNDRLNGQAGIDSMAGGLGDDIYYVDEVDDDVMENADEGTDMVVSTVSFVLGSNLEELTLTGAALVDGTGNNLGNRIVGNMASNTLSGQAGDDVIIAGDGDDTLDGGDGDDRLNGQAGADAMTGGAGDDIYYVDEAGDTVSENADEGIDTVVSTTSFVLGDHIEKLTLSGAAIADGTGNALDNRIVGNAAANILLGLAGDDVIIAGDGDDTLDGGNGNDRLNGQAGADAMIGGLGDDIYYVDNLADTISENADEGVDTVVSTVSHTLGSNVEKLTLTGTVIADGIGNGLDNRIVGNGAANALQGLSGDDVMIAGDGDDSLTGGEGDDRLNGGLGNDVAYFAGERSTYSIITNGGSISVIDNNPSSDGDDGTDTISSVEVLSFKNGETVSVASPIILDLGGDGIETISAHSSGARFDLDGDGLTDDTSWIGSGDAFLYLDRDGNNTMSGAEEISFIDDIENAASDLAGLAAFDSDGDGILSANDARFAEFGVWQDTDGDGNVDEGETASLSQIGIESINLIGTPVNGEVQFGDVAIVNTGSFTFTNGVQREFADAALTYFSDAYQSATEARAGSLAFDISAHSFNYSLPQPWLRDITGELGENPLALDNLFERLRSDFDGSYDDLFDSFENRSIAAPQASQVPIPPVSGAVTSVTRNIVRPSEEMLDQHISRRRVFYPASAYFSMFWPMEREPRFDGFGYAQDAAFADFMTAANDQAKPEDENDPDPKRMHVMPSEQAEVDSELIPITNATSSSQSNFGAPGVPPEGDPTKKEPIAVTKPSNADVTVALGTPLDRVELQPEVSNTLGYVSLEELLALSAERDMETSDGEATRSSAETDTNHAGIAPEATEVESAVILPPRQSASMASRLALLRQDIAAFGGRGAIDIAEFDQRQIAPMDYFA